MTRRWWKKTEPLYRRFSHMGRDAAEANEMFMAETYGSRYSTTPTNRYLIGKRNMDAVVSMWREDVVCGILTKGELMNDKTFIGFARWLVKVLRTIPPSTSMFAAELVEYEMKEANASNL